MIFLFLLNPLIKFTIYLLFNHFKHLKIMARKLVFSKLQSPKIRVQKAGPKFKFKKLVKPVLATTNVTLKGGGKIKVIMERNVSDMVKIVKDPNYSASQTDDNWTCSVVKYNGEVYNKDTVILNTNFTKIYPGAIYPFESIALGDYKQPNYDRKPITITTSNSGFKKNFIKVNEPSMATVSQAITDMKKGANIAGKSMIGNVYEVLSEEDLFIRTGGSGYYLGFGGSHNIDFKKNSKTHKYLVEMFQSYYDIVVNDDSNEPTDFFVLKTEEPNNTKAISESLIDPNWVYVDSVSYGRILYVLYESNESFSSFGIDVEAYANFGFAGGEANLSEKQKSFLKTTTVTVSTIGGPLIESALLVNPSSFKDLQKRIENYLKAPGGEAIISYTLRTLDQHNVGAKMVTQFTSRKCAPRASKYKLSWNKIVCKVNDDSGSAEEISAFLRVRAMDGKGADILDIDKKNKAVVEYNKLSKIQRGPIPPPWTFIEGSKNNPLELKEGGSWDPGRSITFKIPKDDKKAKIAIRADVVEYDDSSDNDQFADKIWEKKIVELSDVEDIILTCRHDASRIDFFIRIEPVYE
jgi:thiol-activated cytolysin